MQNRTLYFGDNLDILREKIPDESFDLIYLDPPFNSNRNYNVLFKEGLIDSQAQVQAFEDSWHWTREAQSTFEELIGAKPSQTKTNEQIANLMQALEKIIGHNDVLAYLTMMTIRLIELQRVLKPTGSIYLHCDPTASHYLKIVMDAVFRKENFRNEVVWQRSHPKGHATTRFARNHDVIISFTKVPDGAKWNPQYLPYDPDRAASQYTLRDEDGRSYQLTSLLNPNPDRPNLTYEFLGVTRVWRWTKERMAQEYEKGRIVVPKGGKGTPRYKRYLDEQEGIPIGDFWSDVDFAAGGERLGYPTQKPEALLERIIKASSNEGDWVLDPFCGCGTTVAVAERLNRNWVGIDVTALAINLIKRRLQDHYPNISVIVDGLPRDIAGAKALFKRDPFEFEYWALDLVNAMPAQSKSKGQMRGADRGVDGIITVVTDIQNSDRTFGKLLVQVKGGAAHRDDIATLKGDIERERAIGGVFITLEEPTRPMMQEAVQAGHYSVSYAPGKEFPKIQILTVKELLVGRRPDMPLWSEPYQKKAMRAERELPFQQVGLKFGKQKE